MSPLSPNTLVRIVIDEIDAIVIAHVADGAELVFFCDFIQGEWAVLDHRWLASDMASGRLPDGRWTLFWLDYGDSCWRLMVAGWWAETWEEQSPLAANHNKPWFARLLAPGLKQPPANVARPWPVFRLLCYLALHDANVASDLFLLSPDCAATSRPSHGSQNPAARSSGGEVAKAARRA